MIRLAKPSIEEDDLKAVLEVLETGHLVQGAKVEAFEQAIAGYVGTKHAIVVSNGTASLHLALLALEVKPNDIVITTSYSWLSTANVVELCGAQAVFTDIDSQTFNMCPESLARVLERLMANKETARRVKAILPIHAFGLMADMPKILELARFYDLPVIEDAACALGATLAGKQAGSWGIMGSFSFHPRKAITTGEGGAITTNEDDLAWRLRALRNHGLDPSAKQPRFVMPGFNYRMTEFQAALGLSQFKKLGRIIKARQKAARYYDEMLASTELNSPFTPAKVAHIYQSYVCLLPETLSEERSEIIQKLKHSGVETTIGTWHMPLTDYYQTRYGYKVGDYPNADKVFAWSLSLPLFEEISYEEQGNVVSSLLEHLGINKDQSSKERLLANT